MSGESPAHPVDRPGMGRRLMSLGRALRVSTWRFVALLLTDPRWSPLFESLRRSTPEARFRDPVPWFAWRALPVLEAEVGKRTGQHVMEWGTGASTLWYSRRGLVVTGIEHDEGWYRTCRRFMPGADIRLVEIGASYTNPDIDVSEFGIFVIDGRDRVACARFLLDTYAKGRTADDVLVIFDDSNRDRYQDVLRELESASRRHRSFTGPTSVEIDKMTTFFWFA